MSDVEGSWEPLPPGWGPVGGPGSLNEQCVFPQENVPGIGAFCDLVPTSSDRSSQSFSVIEFLTLSDGSQVPLTPGRGFTIGWAAGDIANHPLTVEDIVGHVLSTVLPDDDVPADAHPWEDLADRARARGADVTAAQLRGWPYEVVLSAQLEAWLARNSAGEGTRLNG